VGQKVGTGIQKDLDGASASHGFSFMGNLNEKSSHNSLLQLILSWCFEALGQPRDLVCDLGRQSVFPAIMRVSPRPIRVT
jgi:hypothetical protein